MDTSLLFRNGKARVNAGVKEIFERLAIAQQHTLSGGSIMNVIRYASLQALKSGSNTVALDDLTQGIRRELAKEGKVA